MFAAGVLAFCSMNTGYAASTRAINTKMEASKGASSIKALPRKYRDALLAELSGLLYMDDVRNPYLSTTGYEIIDGEKVTYQSIDTAARFIGTDGKVYNFAALAFDKMSKPSIQRSWQQSKLYISHVGKDEVLKTFENSIRLMQEKRAEFCLKNMPQKYKDAFLSECAQLLFLDNGESAITNEERSELIKGVRYTYRHVSPGAFFIGSDGKKYDFLAISKERYEKLNRVQTLWQEAKYMISLMGKEEFLLVFRADIAKLRAAKDAFLSTAAQ